MFASSPLSHPTATPLDHHNSYNPLATPVPIITNSTTSNSTVTRAPRNHPSTISPQIGHKRPAGTTPFTPSHQPATPQRRKILAEVRPPNSLQARLDLLTSLSENHPILSPPFVLPELMPKDDTNYNHQESSRIQTTMQPSSPVRKREKENIFTPLPQRSETNNREAVMQSAPALITYHSKSSNIRRSMTSINNLFINAKYSTSTSASATPSNNSNDPSSAFSPINRPKLIHHKTTHSGSPPDKEGNSDTKAPQPQISWSRDYSLFEHLPSSKTCRNPSKVNLDTSVEHHNSKPVFLHYDSSKNQDQGQDYDQNQNQNQTLTLNHNQILSQDQEQEQENIFNERSSPSDTPLQSPTLPISSFVSRDPITMAPSPAQTALNSTMTSVLASTPVSVSPTISTLNSLSSPQPHLAALGSSTKEPQPTAFITSTPMPPNSELLCALSLDRTEQNLMQQMRHEMEFRAWKSEKEVAELKETIDFLELERRFNL
ncbi:hypothetical protein NADFUDRAFT_39833 [Nadsonia fulvescens var. elongata DSM 6958]|uniref:Uncharacterized protein n=1 Tax=Nadsonia fulvescens var. elongata DSM 6958 TaxID=857566 RepID=A0A1E3PT43_9ASCO|nr:hypothetical protein NADFUDRAFT_39833 [Nadsonia fulvescens var. elongata DSM 6958]